MASGSKVKQSNGVSGSTAASRRRGVSRLPSFTNNGDVPF